MKEDITVTKFSKAQSDLIEGFGSAVYNVDGIGNHFYFLPFWFEKVGEGLFIQHPLDKLPTKLINRIKGERNEHFPTTPIIS